MELVYLEDLRKEADLTPTQVLKAFRDVAPDLAPKERSGVVHWEQQGILDFRIIDTLAVVYGRSTFVVKAAALASKARFNARRKNVTKLVSFPIDTM